MRFLKCIYIYAITVYVFYVVLVLMLHGCAKKQVVYKDVYVPVKCNIEIPKRPTLTGELVNDYKNALQHSELLESDLIFCVKGDIK